MELINVNTDRRLYNSYNSYNIINVSNHNLCETYYSNNNIMNYIDLSENFPHIYNQESYGITSSCAIVSVLSYLHKIKYGDEKIFSPYFLACLQYNITHNWNILDIPTGLYILLKKGICLAESFGDTLDLNMIFNENILKEALNNRPTTYANVNTDVNNIINLLNDKIPVLCSIKILPKYNSKFFYECFNDSNYWLDCYNYYLKNNEVYSVSVIIVGYDITKNKFKIRGCWGTNIGISGYIYISFEIFNYFKFLFFDSFIIDLTEQTICKLRVKNINNSDLSEDDCIIKLDNQINPLSRKKSSSFTKINSFSGFSDSTIDIEISDNLNDFINIQNNNFINSNKIEYF
jgi:hypothetical protein